MKGFYLHGGVLDDVTATGQDVGQLVGNERAVHVVVHGVAAGDVGLGDVGLATQLHLALVWSAAVRGYTQTCCTH